MQVQFLEFSFVFCKCKCEFCWNYFYASCYASAFLSIPGFWGTLLGLRNCREDSVGIFALENQSHWVGSIWVVSLEVLRTEMISLQFWLNSIEILASKSSDAYQGQAPREPLGKYVKIGVDFRSFWVA